METEIKFKDYTFIEYTDPKQVTSTTPSIFLIATKETMELKPVSKISLDRGFLTSNPHKILSFDSGMREPRKNEVILLLKHDFKTAKELLPTLLDLMEYHPMKYYDLDTNNPIELEELKDLIKGN